MEACKQYTCYILVRDFDLSYNSCINEPEAKPASVVLLVASEYTRCLAMVISESGFEAQPGPIIVLGYSGVCFEIKFSGRHRGFDGVIFNL